MVLSPYVIDMRQAACSSLGTPWNAHSTLFRKNEEMKDGNEGEALYSLASVGKSHPSGAGTASHYENRFFLPFVVPFAFPISLSVRGYERSESVRATDSPFRF